MRLPPDGNTGTYSTTHNGMSGWDLTLIAVGVTLAVIAVTAVIHRVRPRPAPHPGR